MAVHETNDAGLPNFVCRHTQVIVKFTAEDCPICKELSPVYQELSEEERFRDVIFLRLDAEENPIACKEVKQNGTPFMVTYRNGSLVDHKLATQIEDILNILEKLLK